MNLRGLILFIFSLVCIVVSSKKIPQYIHLCHQNDPNINECFKRAIEEVRPYLKRGIPEFQLPPTDPLYLPEASMESGESFRAVFRNIEVFYSDEFELKQVNVDLKENHVEMLLHFPKLRIKSNYSINGKLLILQLNGNGPADGNFTNVEAKISMNGHRYEKKGKTHLNFDENILTLDLGRPIFDFAKLFKDNDQLNLQTNKIINENIDGILEELEPVVNKIISDFVFGLIDRIFRRFSIDELFPK